MSEATRFLWSVEDVDIDDEDDDEKSRDDRAGPPAIEEARVEVEDAITESFSQVFSRLRDRLVPMLEKLNEED